MIYARLLRDFPGIARNNHMAIRIRLEMNCVRTDLWDALSAEFEQVCAVDVKPLGVDKNVGAALRLAIEEALNDVKYEYAPENAGAWRDPKELLAGPQTYIFDDIEYYEPFHVGYIAFHVRWKNANSKQYNFR
jgi:hypothetical protein